VRTDVEKGYLAVAVADSGHGIAEHLLPRIFEPFFTTKREGKGTGLGLSVSRSWIRKMGGTIRVHSEIGVGTTFTVLLPTTDIPFERPGAAAVPAPAAT
jgi:signal transduction histidine kinase